MSYKSFGLHSILIEWPQKIDENILKDILIFQNKIENKYIELNIEIIIAYNSLTIIYDFTIENVNDRILELKSIYKSGNTLNSPKRTLWEIPACYDREFAIDLEDFSKQKTLSIPEVIQRHSSQIYTIYFIGFLPGFIYLGGLCKSLQLNRKSTPNLNIKKGAIGIGGNQTGIYPQNSPGGWHIIGNSPIGFFDVKNDNPCFAKAGDKVKFVPVSKVEYDDITRQIETNTYRLKSREIHD